MHRHKTFYIDELKEIEYCDSKMLFMSGGEYEIPFPVERTETEHTLENCENCKEHHENLIKEFNEKLEQFPNCCKHHKNLFKLPEFAVGNYSDVPKWAADKIMYSYHHFLHWIDKDDWYDEITQYLDYCIESYGSVPPGFGEPLEFGNYFACLLHIIKHNRGRLESTEIDKDTVQERLEKIISYLESYEDRKENVDRDINLLLAKYNEWYKIFPFNLDYFKPLRSHFRMTLPIFRGRKKQNKYLGTITREIHTKESLAEFLIETTNRILSEINVLTLYESGKLNNAEKIELDLIIEKRRLELKAIALVPNKTNKIYIKTLKDWLKSEKKFINEITPLIKNVKKSTLGSNERPNRSDIAFFCFYTSESKELRTQNPFPSKKAWKEMGHRFGKDDTNIQKMYNIIYKSIDDRLKETKRNNIEYVIENMLEDYPKALILAKKELIMAN